MNLTHTCNVLWCDLAPEGDTFRSRKHRLRTRAGVEAFLRLHIGFPFGSRIILFLWLQRCSVATLSKESCSMY